MAEVIHYHRQRKNHRRQIEHDRAVQSAILRGDTPPEWEEEMESSEMGDTFSIAGDTVHNHYQKQASTAAKVALAAAGLLGAGGIGAVLPWLAGVYNAATTNTTTTITEPAPNMGVGIEVVEGGAETE